MDRRVIHLSLLWLRRHGFNLVLGAYLVTLTSIVCLAFYDFVTGATETQKATTRAVLDGELARFILAVRSDDGGTLLENPREFGRATRPITVLTLNKPFFVYLLNRGNAKTVTAQTLNWAPPNSCVTQFRTQQRTSSAPFGLQACFAAVREDPAGRYIYFSLKYPTEPLSQHLRGKDVQTADFVQLKIQGYKLYNLRLSFETPPLVKARYPSRLKHFDGFHEVSAHLENGQPFRGLSAQAIERQEPSASGDLNFVTMLGRIDANQLLPGISSADPWPNQAVKQLKFALGLSRGSEDDESVARYLSLPFDAPGEALVSIEQAYVSQVRSRALLEAYSTTSGKQGPVWSSASLDVATPTNDKTTMQLAADKVTEWVMRFLRLDETQKFKGEQMVVGANGLGVNLTSVSPKLPEQTRRSFTWILITLVLLIPLLMIVYREFKRSRLAFLTRANQMREAEELVKSRHSILDAVGHEIRSPLQTLLIKNPLPSANYADLQRMKRAVEALYFATSIASGLKNGTIELQREDIATALSDYCQALTEEGNNAVYHGEKKGVFAICDLINLGTVLSHVSNNAIRYREPGTPLEVRLSTKKDSVVIEMVNHGRQIPEARLEEFFDLGTTDGQSPHNFGLGLFVSRLHMANMQGSIYLENRKFGVAVVMQLPLAP